MKTRSKFSCLGVVSLLLVACGITRTTVDLRPEHWQPRFPDIRIEAVEIRLPTSTIPVGIVTQVGRVVGVVGGTARPLIDIPLSLIGAGATVTGAGLMGGAIKSGLKSIESVTPAP